MDSDLLQVIELDFPPDQHEAASAALQRYGDEDYHREQQRVRLAALKLANGDLEQLQKAIDAARIDYRDVLAWAEYPNEMDRSIGRNRLTKDEATEADAQQMRDWRAAYGLVPQQDKTLDAGDR